MYYVLQILQVGVQYRTLVFVYSNCDKMQAVGCISEGKMYVGALCVHEWYVIGCHFVKICVDTRCVTLL